MKKAFYLPRDKFGEFTARLAEKYRILAPRHSGASLCYAPHDAEKGMDLFTARTREPLKTFFFPPRETVYAGVLEEQGPTEEDRVCVLGCKSCDLDSLKLLDRIFLEESPQDPFYRKRRDGTILISADCLQPESECFCLAMGVEPFPEEGFDLNLSPLDEGFVLEVGSARGEGLVEEMKSILEPADQGHLEQRDHQRSAVRGRVRENLQREEVPQQEELEGMVALAFDSSIWQEEAEECVECGACNTVCPTCHCFLIHDQTDSDRMERFRAWDSCLLRDFARVAGGGNPRPQLWTRLRNRFAKKFDFFPQVADTYACTGCGRCIEACPAGIDIRHVLKRVVGYGKRRESVQTD